MSDRQLKLQFVLIGRSTEPGWKLRDKLPSGSAQAWAVCSASLKNGVAAFRQSHDRQVCTGSGNVCSSIIPRPNLAVVSCFFMRHRAEVFNHVRRLPLAARKHGERQVPGCCVRVGHVVHVILNGLPGMPSVCSTVMSIPFLLQ